MQSSSQSSLEVFCHPCVLHFLVSYLVPPNKIANTRPWKLESWKLDLCFIIISSVGLEVIVRNFFSGSEIYMMCSWDFSLHI